MADPFVAEIRIVPFNFAPLGWAECNGQLMPISQNTALFSLVGTNFGGDGKSTFGLPNLQGSVAMDWGNGAGLTGRVIGEVGGEKSVTLSTDAMPTHAHTQNSDGNVGQSTSPTNNLLAVPAVNPRLPKEMYAASAANTPMLAGNVLEAGGGQPHNNLQPYLVLNYIIALQGVFPSRS